MARNAALPTLEVLLSKDLVNLHLSSLIAFDKRYISTFQNLPDVPVTTFQLDQPQGPSSSLAWHGLGHLFAPAVDADDVRRAGTAAS